MKQFKFSLMLTILIGMVSSFGFVDFAKASSTTSDSGVFEKAVLGQDDLLTYDYSIEMVSATESGIHFAALPAVDFYVCLDHDFLPDYAAHNLLICRYRTRPIRDPPEMTVEKSDDLNTRINKKGV